MLRSLYAGVSGMRVHQVKMDVIGNNIANVNTTGYKGGSVTFKDMLSQTMRAASEPSGIRGGLNPMQVGLGVSVGSIDTDFSQGNLQATGKMTDIAIQGNGFFVVNDGSKNAYTRAGVFTFDEAGNFIHRTTGYRVQGWMTDVNGNWPNMNLSTMQNISLGELNMPPTATSVVKYKGNLDTTKEVVDLAYGPERINISDAIGNTADLYITTSKVNGAATPDRADDRWEWVASTDIKVVGELQAANAQGAPIPLNNPNVNWATIMITDATSGTTYVKDVDYTVDTVTNEITFTNATLTYPVSLSVDYEYRSEITRGEVSVDETGKVRTSSVATFDMFLYDTGGNPTANPISISTPVVGDENGGIFTVNSPGINARKIEGEYGPMRTTAQKVYDSKGTQYILNVSFVKTGENRWDWFATPPVDASGNEIPVTNASGTVFFDNAGKVMGQPTGGPISFQPQGSDRVTITPDFSSITQFEDDDSCNAYYGDGYEAGALESFSIDGAGTIIGSYSNGLSRQIAKIALANFSNPAGLMRTADTIFTDSNNSGAAEIGLAGGGGLGEVSAGTLEMSNVDLADQFTEMITTQRGFQASSKIIQTADQILQDLVNLKR